MYQEVPNLTPVRDITTYFHLVSMAMGERHRDTTLSREFRISRDRFCRCGIGRSLHRRVANRRGDFAVPFSIGPLQTGRATFIAPSFPASSGYACP